MTDAEQAGVDRRQWAARIGVRFAAVDDPDFKRLYPFASRLHRIEGHHYHYLDEGAGEPVVMVHGNPTWSFFYRNLTLGLRGKYRCLVPDHMGCGFSDKPQKYPYSLERHVRNLEIWLEDVLPPASEAGGRINLIVHDWGGPIGLSYAVRRPERIKRVVVLNTSVFVDGSMPLRIRLCRTPWLGALLVRGLNGFAGLATRLATVEPLPADVRSGFLVPYNSWNNRVAVHKFVLDIPLKAGTPTHADFVRLDGNVGGALAGKPLLVQWGMKDWCFTPSFLAMWRRRFPEAEVNEYFNAGHYLLEDAGAEILGRIATFLERPAT